MTDDLSTRLLAAVAAVEEAARGCIDEVGPERVGDTYTDGSGEADRDAFPSYPWASLGRELAFMAGPGHPDDVLRLCQAHREVVAQFQRAWDRRNNGDERERLVRQAQCVALIDVLHWLACGYGIEDTA